MTAVAWTSPVVELDLSFLLGGGVDGSTITSDPFVLESGNIKPVEAYFNQLLQYVINYDFETHPSVKVFSSTVRAIPDIFNNIFPNVLINNRIGGKRYGGE